MIEELTEQEVHDIMESCGSAAEWKANCKYVKFCFDGKYPEFWYRVVIASGLADQVQRRWTSRPGITITTESA